MDETPQQQYAQAKQLAEAGEWEQAIPLYLAAAQGFGAAEQLADVGRCYYALGRYARDVAADYTAAEVAYLTALTSFASAGDKRLPQLYVSLMLNAAAADWRAKAAGFGMLALAEAEMQGDEVDLFTVTNNLAFLYADGDDVARGVAYAERSLNHAQRLNRAKEIALGEYALGYAQERAGNVTEAERHYRLSLRRSDAIAEPADAAVAVRSLARLLSNDADRHDEAARLYADAVRRFAALGDAEAAAEMRADAVTLSPGPSRDSGGGEYALSPSPSPDSSGGEK